MIVLSASLLLSACTGAQVATSWPGMTVDQDTLYMSYASSVYAINANNGSYGLLRHEYIFFRKFKIKLCQLQHIRGIHVDGGAGKSPGAAVDFSKGFDDSLVPSYDTVHDKAKTISVCFGYHNMTGIRRPA